MYGEGVHLLKSILSRNDVYRGLQSRAERWNEIYARAWRNIVLSFVNDCPRKFGNITK